MRQSFSGATIFFLEILILQLAGVLLLKILMRGVGKSKNTLPVTVVGENKCEPRIVAHLWVVQAHLLAGLLVGSK